MSGRGGLPYGIHRRRTGRAPRRAAREDGVRRVPHADAAGADTVVKITPLAIPDVLLVEPAVYCDERGFFLETWQAERYAAAGIGPSFLQDNHSRSVQGTLRGLHYQMVR